MKDEFYFMKRKLIWAWVFAIPLFISMILMRVFGIEFLSEKNIIIFMMTLSFPVVFIFGWDTIKAGFRGIFSLYFNMDSLIGLGTVVSYLTGFFAYFGFISDYSGVSGMIMAIFITGKYIEARARGKATQEIRKLLELGAKNARLVKGSRI